MVHIFHFIGLQVFISTIVLGSSSTSGEATVSWPVDAIECKFVGCFVNIFYEFYNTEPTVFSCLNGNDANNLCDKLLHVIRVVYLQRLLNCQQLCHNLTTKIPHSLLKAAMYQ